MNEKCQVFTPEDYVNKLLDSIGYTEFLYGKSILENSCGDGNILSAIVQRYIDDCKKQGLSRTKIKNGLAKDITGYEIDGVQYNFCLQKLDAIVEKNGIQPVQWRIYRTDYLKDPSEKKYDYIVANPPYLNYTDIAPGDRNYLKEHFTSCSKGKFDYCFAFIEKGMGCLTTKGKMSYLIPSSIFKTVSGKKLREQMLPYIDTIIDYTQNQVFDGALVKSAIMILKKKSTQDYLEYIDKTQNIEIRLLKQSMGDRWFFSATKNDRKHRFGDYFKIAHVVATLLNEAYVLSEKGFKQGAQYCEYNGCQIETSIVRKTATPRTLHFKKKEWIIFPYDYVNGKLVRYNEDDFIKKYPSASEYLMSFSEKLSKRKSDKNAKWFEYGRSQALNEIANEKLLLSTVITGIVAVYHLDADVIPYGGMYIIPHASNSEFSLSFAQKLLESKDFLQYALDVGIHINSNSVRITSKDIEEYRF